MCYASRASYTLTGATACIGTRRKIIRVVVFLFDRFLIACICFTHVDSFLENVYMGRYSSMVQSNADVILSPLGTRLIVAMDVGAFRT